MHKPPGEERRRAEGNLGHKVKVLAGKSQGARGRIGPWCSQRYWHVRSVRGPRICVACHHLVRGLLRERLDEFCDGRTGACRGGRSVQ